MRPSAGRLWGSWWRLSSWGPLGWLSRARAGCSTCVWVVLAGVGVALLARPSGSVGVAGLLFALLAAACWGAFIVIAKRTVNRMEPLRATTLMLLGAAIILTPIWLATGVKIAGYGHALLLGLAVAVLSSALPYFLELAAIKRVRASTYGVLLSVEPAIAALMGFLILSQRLVYREIGAIVAIVVAAAGASWLSASGGKAPADAAPLALTARSGAEAKPPRPAPPQRPAKPPRPAPPQVPAPRPKVRRDSGRGHPLAPGLPPGGGRPGRAVALPRLQLGGHESGPAVLGPLALHCSAHRLGGDRSLHPAARPTPTAAPHVSLSSPCSSAYCRPRA